MSFFDVRIPGEKGGREWDAFNAVRDDSIGAYRVATPRKHLVVRGPSNILRIIAPHYHQSHSHRPYYRQSGTLRSAH